MQYVGVPFGCQRGLTVVHDKDGLHGLVGLLAGFRYCQLRRHSAASSIKCRSIFEATYVRIDGSTEDVVDPQPYEGIRLADRSMQHAKANGYMTLAYVDYGSQGRVIF